jgi:5-enolpyruvylshikimate-3-phosphate synthase
MAVETCDVRFVSTEKFIDYDIVGMILAVQKSLVRCRNAGQTMRIVLGPAAAERLARQQGLPYPMTLDGGMFHGMPVSIDPSFGPWDIRGIAEQKA